ncbi:hypothetical protein CUZ89_1212 [Enterococcus xinjiangensis]|nr:hypothetical protein [Enterococcus lactis]MBL5003031.1 hypothetical protein [Enterococcus lactis]
MFITFCCWSTGGLSLVFSTKINSQILKMLVILLDLIGIYGWLIFAR